MNNKKVILELEHFIKMGKEKCARLHLNEGCSVIKISELEKRIKELKADEELNKYVEVTLFDIYDSGNLKKYCKIYGLDYKLAKSIKLSNIVSITEQHAKEWKLNIKERSVMKVKAYLNKQGKKKYRFRVESYFIIDNDVLIFSDVDSVSIRKDNVDFIVIKDKDGKYKFNCSDFKKVKIIRDTDKWIWYNKKK